MQRETLTCCCVLTHKCRCTAGDPCRPTLALHLLCVSHWNIQTPSTNTQTWPLSIIEPKYTVTKHKQELFTVFCITLPCCLAPKSHYSSGDCSLYWRTSEQLMMTEKRFLLHSLNHFIINRFNEKGKKSTSHIHYIICERFSEWLFTWL